jgi:hypothetical protein
MFATVQGARWTKEGGQIMPKNHHALIIVAIGCCLTGCSLIGNQVRGAMGMAPVETGQVTVVNNGVTTICKMHVANEGEPYVESYSLISTQYEYLASGAHHKYEVMVHGKPLKVRLSSCDGTVLKEQHDMALASNGAAQVVVP